MGYSNFDKVSSSEGYAVGAPASEREVINSTGVIYLPKLTNAGAPILTSIGTATTKGTFNATTTTLTLTTKITMTHALQFYKVKLVGKTGANAAIKVVGKVNGTALGTGCATTQTKSKTSVATTSTNTKPLTGKGTAPILTAAMTATLDTAMTGTNTKGATLSIATFSAGAMGKFTLNTIT